MHGENTQKREIMVPLSTFRGLNHSENSEILTNDQIKYFKVISYLGSLKSFLVLFLSLMVFIVGKNTYFKDSIFQKNWNS